jgi:bile acid:Na+ symporter, BASS family
MDDRKSCVARFSRFIHQRFFWLVIGSYVLAALFPPPGLWLRGVTFGESTLFRERTKITLPVMMLALLLFNSGLGVQTSQLRSLVRRPLVLITGLLANLMIPVVLVFGVTQGMRFWHNPDEVQSILVGLALVASMPIAGSSTAWSQNANGDLALSLALVLFSTFLSPVTTPLALHAVGLLASRDYAEALHELASASTGAFLAIGVLFPSVVGIVVHRTVGEARIASAKPLLKLVNSMNLLLLNYANASVSLPQTVADPDWDFLAVTLGIVVGLCVLAFAAGWLIARFLKASEAQQTSLMFGLGMNNNGTGLVLASMALADHPRGLLPIIFWNLVQHLIAAGVDVVMCRPPTRRHQHATGKPEERQSPSARATRHSSTDRAARGSLRVRREGT